MKFRNRVVNPVVRLLLGSPLHRLFSSSLVTLAYQGRTTGGWHRLPCMDARDGQDLDIVAAQPHRKLIDPLLDAIDACIHDHTTPSPSARTARRLLGAYLAVLNPPSIGPRLHSQNQQLRTLLTGPNTSPSARLRAEAALGAIWRPLIAKPPLDLTDPTHQHTLVDAAVATLQPSRSSPDRRPVAAAQSVRTPSTRT